MSALQIKLMTAADYHASRSLSKSGLDQLRKSPAHFKAWQDGSASIETTPAMEFGTAAHMAVLEPQLFIQRHKPFNGDKRAKEGKAIWQAILDAGHTPLGAETWDAINHLASAVHAHPSAASLINDIEPETSWFDNWNGVEVKARLDGIADDYIIDLKTTQDASPAAFAKSVAQFRYHVQAAWYQRITGIKRFVFIAVEKEAPFGVCCYELDQQAIDLGNEIIDAQLATYRECQALNSWPCYSSTVQTLSLPSWAMRSNTEIL